LGAVRVKVSPDLTSQVAEALLEEIRDWQNRPIDSVYPMIFFDLCSARLR
jgi:putative transposase